MKKNRLFQKTYSWQMLIIVKVLAYANACVKEAVTLKRDTLSPLLHNNLLNNNNNNSSNNNHNNNRQELQPVHGVFVILRLNWVGIFNVTLETMIEMNDFSKINKNKHKNSQHKTVAVWSFLCVDLKSQENRHSVLIAVIFGFTSAVI